MFGKKCWKKLFANKKERTKGAMEKTTSQPSAKTVNSSMYSKAGTSKSTELQDHGGVSSRIFHSYKKSNIRNGDTETVQSRSTLGEAATPKSESEGFSTSTEGSQTLSDVPPPPHPLDHETHNEDPAVVKSYDAIPILEMTKLPRGGVSMETEAVGRVQFGIPPETIKDSMRLGLDVPTVYIVPVERFCREMGPALGVNLAEFEFPAYFNFFVLRKRCTLIVDSDDAEQNIRRVFSETLLGPAQFRREKDPKTYEEEDFAPDFPRDAIPNFAKELEYFRIMPDGKELVLETLIKFCHFNSPGKTGVHENLGIPPPIDEELNENGNVDNCYSERQSSDEDFEEGEGALVPDDIDGVDQREEKRHWTYSHARFDGDVATIYPSGVSEKEPGTRSGQRVEIFKMPGGTEYIVHDIDEHNHIVGKARFSGHVRVSEKMSVAGFGSSMSDDDEEEKFDNNSDDEDETSLEAAASVGACDSVLGKGPPTFHPPSFGVTVLGNSHGFDKSGSVSGYVLWINGRGVMIDPPPYSSRTLEKEGIRPRTIVGIILTHCHADHDAGAFQKVLTGSQVVVITTPTIYKSFIRKYAALSNLSPVLLRHSHRYKAVEIGTPLRFQGATFHFTYSLHTIPCVGFRVEWRGRSLVFTGDHFNSPPDVDKLQETGVLSEARANDLRNLPLQETDLLLHEAGAPPIHTPLDVLLQLPNRVKKRMYVVHTSALPEGCELRVAPTGTAGTIRLDQVEREKVAASVTSTGFATSFYVKPRNGSSSLSFEDEGSYHSPWNSSNEYDIMSPDVTGGESDSSDALMASSFANLSVETGHKKQHRFSMMRGQQAPPLVSLRPSSSTDAWFVLNLLSSVPFLTSLSYASTMEVLETARVDAFCQGQVVVPSHMRGQVLCVIWEGTCVEREKDGGGTRRRNSKGGLLRSIQENEQKSNYSSCAVWHAGDWTGPLSLQPEKRLSGDSPLSETHDVVAMSSEGVKVITIEFSSLHAILKSGSSLYRKYLERKSTRQLVFVSLKNEIEGDGPELGETTKKELQDLKQRNMSLLELLNTNYTFRKLSAVQKRHLESLAEGPLIFGASERLWSSGATVEKAYIVVAGTVSFAPKRRNAGSVSLRTANQGKGMGSGRTIGESMRIDAIKARKELGAFDSANSEESAVTAEADFDHPSIELDTCFGGSKTDIQGELRTSLTEAHDFERIRRGLQKRAELVNRPSRGNSASSMDSLHYDDSLHDDDSHPDFDIVGIAAESPDTRGSLKRRRSSRARHANKVLGRLYSRRAFTSGLVFSRGHFLGDVSKMVAGLLSSDADMSAYNGDSDDGGFPKYGFGDDTEGGGASDAHRSVGDIIIHEQEGDENVLHSSTLIAGKDGCVVLVFQKSSLIPFLDEYPGLLLSLLGTQVVV